MVDRGISWPRRGTAELEGFTEMVISELSGGVSNGLACRRVLHESKHKSESCQGVPRTTVVLDCRVWVGSKLR